jgi:Protein of unknown function (DUF3592)
MLGGFTRMLELNAKESFGRLIGTAFIVIGSLVAIAGLIWLVRTVVFVSGATKASGQVIAMERSEGSKGGSAYHPVFTFADSAGIVHTQRSSFGSSDYSFEAGERVTVLYDSTTPKRSKIESFQTVWLGPVFVTGFGLLFGGFACFWLFMWTRAARLQKQ